MTPEDMRQRAIELFNQRFHCSQAILAVGQEKLNRVNEAVIKAVGALGGGVASSGRVCGTLTGGVAFISSLYSRGNLEESTRGTPSAPRRVQRLLLDNGGDEG